MSPNTAADGLKSLEDGKVPECRMASAIEAQAVVQRLITNDEKRSGKRAKVAGIVDGNPPYSWRKLREAGRATACNVNFGTARTYVESAVGAYYDLGTQAPGHVQITTSYGNEQEQIDYSRIMSREADLIFDTDTDWDKDVQLSQQEMVLYGFGPLMFENENAVFPISIEAGDLLVPNRTRSKVSRWELSVVLWDYYPPELYDFIQNEEAAAATGWNVAYTKSVIENAMGASQDQAKRRNWEWHQNELKSNSYNYRNDEKVCKVAHMLWREFPKDGETKGRVTHAIVERTTTATPSTATGIAGEAAKKAATQYLFIKVGRYADFKEDLHPMYYDRGRGGYHHNVTGMGVKLYGPMEYENRLLCNQMDKAFAPKTIFKAGTAEAMTKFQLATYGDYCVVGPGIDAMQNPIQGFLQDGLAMYRTSADLMRSNLSASRQQVAPEKPGNPVTAFEKRAEISEQSSLSATTFNHHYKEMDCLYGEIVRRLCNLNSTDERAQQFQERCEEAGVPKECFGRIVSVKAVRVTGQGSPFMRQQSLMGLQGVVMGCPEDGQNNWRNDVIAAYSGQNAVSRYNPPPGSTKLATDQRERANTQIGLMKLGQQATITSSQNATTFAGAFLDACISALQSVQKGADPKEVVGFLELAAPAAQAHIKRMINDPMRKQIAEALLERWQQVAKLTDRLKQQIQQSAEEQKAQQAKQQQAMSDEQIKQQQAEHGMQLKTAKTAHQLQERNIRTRADLADKEARTRQDLAISDATAAAEIHRKNAQAEAEREAAKKAATETPE